MFAIEPSPEILSRSEFGVLCNRYGVVQAAEVGVDCGEFSEQFLKTWVSPGRLLLIDPYLPYEGMPWPREFDKALVVARMLPYADRIRFLQWKSPEAARQLHGDWHLQFVYIDGCHLYASVKADLEAWWERIDAGGILAGHDFVKGTDVFRAVKEFAKARNLTVYHTIEGGTPISFYIHKPA
jgi:hypothetical protein